MVISHTEHFISSNGIVGWGPTVREMNAFTTIFDKVIHIAPLYTINAPMSSLPYNDNVEFVAIKPTGGKSFLSKINTLLKAPDTLQIVNRYLKVCDYYQFRAPTGMGVYMIPWLEMKNKKGWYKYAGNWQQQNSPVGYQIQKFYLNRLFNRRKVTINGKWFGQRPHLHSFENPCLTEVEIDAGKEILKDKEYTKELNLLYVGRIEYEKGLDLFLESLSYLPQKISNRIGEINIIGEGKNYSEIKKKYTKNRFNIKFHGALDREGLNKYYKCSHFLFLASRSEGFPKVVAEAACFGCIPCVSNVSAISQYVNRENGLLFSSLKVKEMAADFVSVLSRNGLLKQLAVNASIMSEKFTYTRYCNRIKNEILDCED